MFFPFSPRIFLTSWTSEALRMKDANTISTSCSTPNFRSWMSLSDTQQAGPRQPREVHTLLAAQGATILHLRHQEVRTCMEWNRLGRLSPGCRWAPTRGRFVERRGSVLLLCASHVLWEGARWVVEPGVNTARVHTPTTFCGASPLTSLCLTSTGIIVSTH